MGDAPEIDTNGAATLIVAWRGGRNVYCRVLKAGGDVIEALRSYAALAVERLGDNEGHAYDPDDQQEDDQIFLSASREELLDTVLMAQIERGSSLPLIAPDDLKHHTIILYALLVGNDSNSRAVFVRKGSPVKLATKSLVAVFDETLTRVTDPILAFDQNFDVLIKGESVWVLNQRNFEALFKESEAVLAKTAKWAEDLAEALPISDEGREWLKVRLRQNSIMRRKVQSILRGPYLTKLSVDVMSKRMLGHGLDPDELIKDGLLVFNRDTEASILLFLNEDLWTGDFSGEHYAATRKARV